MDERRIRALSFLKMLQYWSELMVVSLSMKSMYTTPWKSQKTVSVTMRADATALNFFGADDPLWRYSIVVLLFSGSKWCTQLSSPGVNVLQKVITFTFMALKQLCANVRSLLFDVRSQLARHPPSTKSPISHIAIITCTRSRDTLRSKLFLPVWWEGSPESVAVPDLSLRCLSHKSRFAPWSFSVRARSAQCLTVLMSTQSSP